MTVYVDDFKLAGPSANLAEGWNLIRSHIKTEDPEPVTHYLGCTHRASAVKMPDGTVVKTMEYDMQGFSESSVEAYSSMHLEITGKVAKCKHVDSPFLLEDHSECPAGKPCASGPSVTCTWCQASFPVGSLPYDTTVAK